MRKSFFMAVAAVVAMTLATQLLSGVSQSRADRVVDLGFVAPEICPEPVGVGQLTIAGEQVQAATLGKKPKVLAKAARRDRSVVTGSASYITGTEHSGLLSASTPAVTATTCRAAQIDSWFVGGSGLLESQSSLVMINQSAAAATAEISAWTPNGPLAPSTLTIPALGTARLSLDRFGAGSVVTRVRALSGRIGLYLLDQRARGLTKLGSDYVPAQATAERKSVILGIVGNSASRLRLLVPGSQDGVVRIDVAFGGDRYTPSGFDALRVKAGSVIELPLTMKSSTGYGALIIDADVPVVAGVYVPIMQRNRQQDFAWLSPSQPLSATALALNPPGVEDSLLFYTEDDSNSVSATDVNGKSSITFVAKPFAMSKLNKSLRISSNQEMYAAQIVKATSGIAIIPINPIERSQQRLAPISDLRVLAPR